MFQPFVNPAPPLLLPGSRAARTQVCGGLEKSPDVLYAFSLFGRFPSTPSARGAFNGLRAGALQIPNSPYPLQSSEASAIAVLILSSVPT
jgi:hypothetical protein